MWALFQRLDRLPFKKLYLILISIFFLGLVLMQVLSARLLHTQRENAKWVELIGRQSMLSQQMVKLALLTEREKGNLENIVHQLSLLNEEWSQVHFNLKFGSSHEKMSPPGDEKIQNLIHRIQPHKDGISDAINELLMVAHVNELRPEAIHKIRTHEPPFLLLMNDLAVAHQLESEKSITLLSNIKLFIFLLSLLALLLLFGLSKKIQFSDRHVYKNRWSTRKKFFRESVADEFMLSQMPDKRQTVEEPAPSEGNVKKRSMQSPLTPPTQRIRILMIADASLPTDYIAWFLNKWEIDFSIVKNLELALKEAQSQTFDVVLMSHPQALAHEKSYFFVKKAGMIKIPIVTLEDSDVKEIYAQIYEEDTAGSAFKNEAPGALYKKIREQLSKEIWGA